MIHLFHEVDHVVAFGAGHHLVHVMPYFVEAHLSHSETLGASFHHVLVVLRGQEVALAEALVEALAEALAEAWCSSPDYYYRNWGSILVSGPWVHQSIDLHWEA